MVVAEGFPLGKLVVEQGPWACGNIGATGKLVNGAFTESARQEYFASGARRGDRGQERADGAAQVGTGQVTGPGPGDLVEQ
jgi:hypothetical protein